MFILEISTSIDCPMRCNFCPQDKLTAAYSGPRLMELETFNAALANCPAGCPVSFAGMAEPYLNPRMSRMVQDSADAGHPFDVYTTAVGMNWADVSILAACRPRFVTLHLPDGEGVMHYTPTAEYVAVVKALAASGLDVRTMAMGKLHPDLVPLFGDLAPLPMQSRAGNVDGFVKMNHRGALRCGPAPELDHPVLLPSGEICLCCQDYSLEHVVGNLAKTPWDEIAAGEVMTEIRRRMASEGDDILCRSCCYAEVKPTAEPAAIGR